jgi:sortase A
VHNKDVLRDRLRYAGVTRGLVAPRPVRTASLSSQNNVLRPAAVHAAPIAQKAALPTAQKTVHKPFAQHIKKPVQQAPKAQPVAEKMFTVPKTVSSLRETKLDTYLLKSLQLPDDKTSHKHHRWHRQLRTKKRKTPVLMTAMAMLVFVAGIGVSVQGFLTNKHVEAQVAGSATSEQSETEQDVPAEDKQSTATVSSYRVAPDLPRVVRIPKLNVEARIVRLGMKTSGKLGAPSNIYDVGWYEGSSRPNENGAMLLAGHVHGPTKPGIFYKLHTLQKGDTFEVERGDGQTFKYRVVESQSYNRDKVDMAKAMTPIIAGERGLNIITCSGDLDDSGNHYEERLVVFATLAN